MWTRAPAGTIALLKHARHAAVHSPAACMVLSPSAKDGSGSGRLSDGKSTRWEEDGGKSRPKRCVQALLHQNVSALGVALDATVPLYLHSCSRLKGVRGTVSLARVKMSLLFRCLPSPAYIMIQSDLASARNSTTKKCRF